MTTLELLRQRAPVLAGIIEASDCDTLRRISSSIAHAVVKRSGLADPLVIQALQHLNSPTHPQPELRARVESLAERLDADYFNLQEMCESGKASDAEVAAAFAKARAATAVAAALGDAISETVAETAYEAVCAIDNSEEYFTGIAQSVSSK